MHPLAHLLLLFMLLLLTLLLLILLGLQTAPSCWRITYRGPCPCYCTNRRVSYPPTFWPPCLPSHTSWRLASSSSSCCCRRP